MFGLLLGSGCVDAYRQSVGTVPEVYQRVFLTDQATAWAATLESLKSVRLDVSNQESGFIQTRWTENTIEKNFTERGIFMKAQYRFLISVVKGFYNGRPSVKVTVQKEQLIQRDVLEGWKRLESDSLEEHTLLYRIGRLIAIKTKLAKLEQEKTEKAIEQSGF